MPDFEALGDGDGAARWLGDADEVGAVEFAAAAAAGAKTGDTSIVAAGDDVPASVAHDNVAAGSADGDGLLGGVVACCCWYD